MPTVWMILITTWAMKTKKKAMKLNELSVLRGESNERQKWGESAGVNAECVQWRAGLLEGLVDGPEPAHVGAGGEEDEPQEGHAEVGRPAASAHPRQTANQINSQCCSVHCEHHRDMTGKMVYGRHPTGCITHNSAGLNHDDSQQLVSTTSTVQWKSICPPYRFLLFCFSCFFAFLSYISDHQTNFNIRQR